MKNLKSFLGIVICVVVAMAVTFTTIEFIKDNELGGKTADVNGDENQKLNGPASAGKEIDETLEGLKFEIKLDKESYTIDDKIRINVKVTNITDKTIIYNTPSTTKDYFYIGAMISAPQYDRNFVYIPKEGEDGAFDDAIGVHELKAGESLEDNFTFIPKVNLNGNELAVSSGEYTAQISVMLENDRYAKVTVPVIIGEGKEQITKEQAQNIAEDHSEIKAWLDARSQESLTKIEDGQYYILEAYGWQAVAKEFYDDLFKVGVYEVNFEYQEDYWKVIYISKFGSAPNRIEAKIDLKTGDIKLVESFDK